MVNWKSKRSCNETYQHCLSNRFMGLKDKGFNTILNVINGKGVTTMLNVILKDKRDIHSSILTNILHGNKFKLSENPLKIKTYETLQERGTVHAKKHIVYHLTG